ncbi:hypothetical protein HDU98_009686 [Podochytrium sp. JEL0797]|nr:hypothetical protein HDU98_009686 [Podochytrium sp. JEL0797]
MIILVTGANSGIGLGGALALAKDPANTVVIAARSADKNEAAVRRIQEQTGNQNVVAMRLDLSSLENVASFAEAFKAVFNQLDGLVCNAGIVTDGYAQSADGYELTFATNHLGHFLLIQLLLPLLEQTQQTTGRKPHVVLVSSFAHHLRFLSSSFITNHSLRVSDTNLASVMMRQKPDGYGWWPFWLSFDSTLAYSNSKVLNAVTGFHLAHNQTVANVSVYDPGWVPTDICYSRGWVMGFFFQLWACVFWLIWKRASTVERSGGFVARLVSGEGKNGIYYSVEEEEEWADLDKHEGFGLMVWNESLALCEN